MIHFNKYGNGNYLKEAIIIGYLAPVRALIKAIILDSITIYNFLTILHNNDRIIYINNIDFHKILL